MQGKYANFDLDLRQGTSDDEYVAAVNYSYAGGQVYTTFKLPFNEDELRTIGSMTKRTMRQMRPIRSSETTSLTLEAVGQRLFEAIFTEGIDTKLQQSLVAARADGYNGLRIRLWLEKNVPELAELPWEYLCDRQEKFLALYNETPLVRYLKVDRPTKVEPVSPPLRILAIVSDPKDVDKLDVENEWLRLRGALKKALDDGQIILERLPKATLTALKERLKTDDVHVIHFIGHGYHGTQIVGVEEKIVSGLVFENRKGNAAQIDTDLLQPHLEDKQQLRLLFLNSCDGARGGSNDAFAGTAQKLVENGLPIVVAMQFKISDDAASELSREFYESIAEGQPVDLAITEARLKIHTIDENRQEWGTPVLFSRLDDNQLIEANPAPALLKAMDSKEGHLFTFGSEDYLPLPVDVIHTNGCEQNQTLTHIGADVTASADFLDTIDALFRNTRQPAEQQKGMLVILEGNYGTNKTTQLRRLAVHTMREEVKTDVFPKVLPLYIDLKNDLILNATNRITNLDDLLALIKARFDTYSPALTMEQLQSQLDDQQIKLRLLFDHFEALSSSEREEFTEQLQTLIQEHPHNDYLLAVIPSALEQDDFAKLELHYLAIQPLFSWRIRHFLQSLSEDGDKFLQPLSEKQLLGLAANPGILVNLVRDLQRGRTPKSRTQTMKRLLNDCIALIPPEQGMRGHAEPLLVELAWAMQVARRRTWSIAQTFVLMNEIRGHRGYRLEAFYDELQKARLLTSVDDEQLEFTQAPMRAFCSANALVQLPDRTHQLDEIMATFGRPSRLRWWQTTIIFLSGLLSKKGGPTSELGNLLTDLVYGTNLLQSDQVFLAARCLLENTTMRGQEQTGWRLGLAHQIVEALSWRLFERNELNAVKRARAVRLLGQLAHKFPETTASQNLVSVAYTQVHRTRAGEPAYERSNVRVAAAVALLRLQPKKRQKVLKEFSLALPQLIKLFEHWEQRDISELITLLHGKDEAIQGLAALALGEVYGQFKAKSRADETMEAQAKRAFKELKIAFESMEIFPDSVQWAIAHAFTYLDETQSYRELIAPFLDQVNQSQSKPSEQVNGQYRCIAYLIGRLRLQQAKAHWFLRQTCLQDSTDPRLWAVAIESLGWLAKSEAPDIDDKSLLEEIATEKSHRFADDVVAGNPQVAEWLQYRAIVALATAGDEDSIKTMRAYVSSQDRQSIPSSLKQAFFESSEMIYWRMKQTQR